MPLSFCRGIIPTPPPMLIRFVLQRFNNCLQLLSCICHCAAIFIEEIRELARLTDILANLMYLSAVGCMTVRLSPNCMRGSLMSSPTWCTCLLYDCEMTAGCWRWCWWCGFTARGSRPRHLVRATQVGWTERFFALNRLNTNRCNAVSLSRDVRSVCSNGRRLTCKLNHARKVKCWFSRPFESDRHNANSRTSGYALVPNGVAICFEATTQGTANTTRSPPPIFMSHKRKSLWYHCLVLR